MSAAPDRLRDRYGRPTSRRRPIALLVVVGIVFLAVVVFVGIRFADQPVRAKAVSYDHLGAQRISLTFELTASPDTPVHCTVQALDKTRGQVGFMAVDIPPHSERQSLQTVEIATQGEAVSADVVECEKA
ncbi:DUF4307 domain-containing protein [Brachybacterium huguangmaarense]|uniref:DUF4307 domain-containing protein n=1 Tax=Brachybacterium huguangmaarense TaxID=1652028 RepID=A0ABY6G1U1_9MICO|nr:DUF4307 domain-containing protein [Brachybacterium huguangmaarense]UYG16929.1 DUF4307 domain-containing protein [Brachybacterium huguangmaarense]